MRDGRCCSASCRRCPRPGSIRSTRSRAEASAGRGASRIPFGRTLVVAQIAVSLVLLVVAGLFVRSLMKLKDVDLGFDPDRVVLFRVSPAG